MAPAAAQAADAALSAASLQISRYEEGARDLISVESTLAPLSIEVFSAHARLNLGARSRVDLSFSEDTWSGATPVTTAPLVANSNRPILRNTDAGVVAVGASPYANTQVNLTSDLQPLNRVNDGNWQVDPRRVLVMSEASPEVRDALDLQWAYDWDNAGVQLGAGVSDEFDYLSRFGSLRWRADFDQKQTTLSMGVGYTTNRISAVLDPDFLPYLSTRTYADQILRIEDSDVLHARSTDWNWQAGLTRILDRNSVLDAGFGYSRGRGFLGNAYKATSVIFVDPSQRSGDSLAALTGDVRALMEQRPEARDQYSLRGRYVRYVAPFDAALHLEYSYAWDDWEIQGHTLSIDWVQPVGAGWTVTPRLRYYSQSAADFYQDYLVSPQAFRRFETDALGRQLWFDANAPERVFSRTTDGTYLDAGGNAVDTLLLDLLPKRVGYDPGLLPAHFSSDHRLSAYGALNGGVTVSRTFRNGMQLEAAVEWYERASRLWAGGDGGSSFADFDFHTANLSLSVPLEKLPGFPAAGQAPEHAHHANHDDHRTHLGHALPASIMYGHLAHAVGTPMVSYRFGNWRQAGPMLNGTATADDRRVVTEGCGSTDGCRFVPTEMSMTMHMVDVMYAPYERLTLMVMPQFMRMTMNLRDLIGRPPPTLETHEHSGISGHTTGGLGDTVVAALTPLWNGPAGQLVGSLGISIPTGDSDLTLRRTFRNDGGLLHFDMQTGSGTWDWLPALTWTQVQGPWGWGAQWLGTRRVSARNDSGYQLGDVDQVSVWAGTSFATAWSGTVRLQWQSRETIQGDFAAYNARIGPMDFPFNQGGKALDAGVGIQYTVSQGALAGNTVGLEWTQPLREDVNGFQQSRAGALALTWQVAL